MCLLKVFSKNWWLNLIYTGQCADIAKELGYKVFAIKDGGQCLTSQSAHLTYTLLGRANDCSNGMGGQNSSDVYSLIDH